MIGERIKKLRDNAGLSQAELARKLGISRSSVNAWESGFSAPTAAYIIEMAKLFHSSSDYILEIDNNETIQLDKYDSDEVRLIHDLLKYFDKQS